MKTLVLSFTFIFAYTGFSQTPKKTYYDYKKTKIMEEYQANSGGFINGTYKKYNEAGALIQTGTAKDGKKEGVWTEYVTYSGKRELAKSETYKNNELNGLSSYYGQNGLLLKQGQYKNNMKDGKWTILYGYENYDLTNEEKKGADYFKYVATYSQDEEIITDGESKTFFYPSGKPHSIQNFKNGKRSGVNKWFYPNGNINIEEVWEENSGQLPNSRKTYWLNGKIMEIKEYDYSSGKSRYEGYNKEGNPNGRMQAEIRDKEIEKEKEMLKVYLLKADSCLVSENLEAAITFYKQAGYRPAFLEAFKVIKDKLSKQEISQQEFNLSYNKLRDDTYYFNSITTQVQLNYLNKYLVIKDR